MLFSTMGPFQRLGHRSYEWKFGVPSRPGDTFITEPLDLSEAAVSALCTYIEPAEVFALLTGYFFYIDAAL